VGYSVWTKFCWLEKGIRGGFWRRGVHLRKS
jgi:hypothetical protein